MLKRIAELTAKRKLAEEKAALLESQLQQKPQVQLEGTPAELLDLAGSYDLIVSRTS